MRLGWASTAGLLLALYATTTGAQLRGGAPLSSVAASEAGPARRRLEDRDVQLNLPGGVSVGVSDSGQVSVQTPWTNVNTGGGGGGGQQVRWLEASRQG